MRDALGDAEQLHDVVQRWARRLRANSGWTVETILSTSENLLAALKDLEPHGTRARRMLAAEARLSRPMMSKLEAIGRHAAMFRLRTANLPPYVSSLYTLTQKPFAEFKKAIEIDLRGLSRSDIARLLAQTPLRRSRLRLITIAIPAGVADETRHVIAADIRTALERIGEEHEITLTISPQNAGKSGSRKSAAKREVHVQARA